MCETICRNRYISWIMMILKKYTCNKCVDPNDNAAKSITTPPNVYMYKINHFCNQPWRVPSVGSPLLSICHSCIGFEGSSFHINVHQCIWGFYIHGLIQILITATCRVWQSLKQTTPSSKVRWANMGPIWGRQDPGGPHVGPMNFAIWDGDNDIRLTSYKQKHKLYILIIGHTVCFLSYRGFIIVEINLCGLYCKNNLYSKNHWRKPDRYG